MPDPLERLRAGLAHQYNLERQIDQGGMATVYLARDLKHERQVALKVLRPELSAVIGAERFLQEIRLTANLQHPHLLPLFDSGSIDGLPYYVSPYVEGESLRERITRRKELGVEEALRLAVQIANALDYAHRHSVIHRDIKPENILLHDGQALVADFGIALAVRAAGGARITETGLSLGTPQYMSPEQAAGDRELDARSDIYSLACVLYEMLAGEPPHSGPTVQAIITKVMTERPRPIATLREAVPSHVAAALEVALAKVPSDRFATAASFAQALEGKIVVTTRATATALNATAVRSPWLRIAPWIVAAAALAWAMTRTTAAGESGDSEHWNVALPDSEPLAFVGNAPLGVGRSSLAISPNGQWIVYVAQAPRGGVTRLVARAVGGVEARNLPGTEGAYGPFFSPDGARIGFFTGNLMKTVALSGTQTPVTITEVTFPYGASWGRNGRIVFSNREGVELQWVTDAPGGSPVRIGKGVQGDQPVLLADGDRVLYQDGVGGFGVISMRTGKTVVIMRDGAPSTDPAPGAILYGRDPKLTASGHLVFVNPSTNTLMAVLFDQSDLSVRGTPVPVLPGIRVEANGCQCAIAENGTIVFAEGSNATTARFVWASRSRRLDTLSLSAKPYGMFALSRDGERLAASELAPSGLWRLDVYTLSGGAANRTGASFSNPDRGIVWPIWSPSSDWLAVSMRGGDYGDGHPSVLRLDPTNGALDTLLVVPRSGVQSPVADSLLGTMAQAIAPDGQTGIFVGRNSGMFARSLDGGTTNVNLGSHLGRQLFPTFSRDGRWLAYTSEEQGRWEVFVEPFPGDGSRRQVTSAGGEEPLWADGNLLFYRSGNQWYSAPVVDGRPRPAIVSTLFLEGEFINVPGFSYAVSRDGSRILLLQPSPDQRTTTLTVIRNWFAELRRVVP